MKALLCICCNHFIFAMYILNEILGLAFLFNHNVLSDSNFNTNPSTDLDQSCFNFADFAFKLILLIWIDD